MVTYGQIRIIGSTCNHIYSVGKLKNLSHFWVPTKRHQEIQPVICILTIICLFCILLVLALVARIFYMRWCTHFQIFLKSHPLTCFLSTCFMCFSNICYPHLHLHHLWIFLISRPCTCFLGTCFMCLSNIYYPHLHLHMLQDLLPTLPHMETYLYNE